MQDALSRALPRWDRHLRVDDVDAYVRRMVVNAHTSWWRKFRRRESPTAEVRTDEVVAGPDGGMAVRRAARGSGPPARRCPRTSAPLWCCATTNSSSTTRSPH